MAVFTPPIDPSVKSLAEIKFRTRSVEFGDGYEEVTGDGINNIRHYWQLTFEALTQSEADDIIDFFLDGGGYTVFQYTVPSDSTQRNYRLDGESITKMPKEGALYEVSFKIKEVFVV